MRIDEIGEKRFLSGLLPLLNTHRSFINGFGDDASVIDVGLGQTAIAMKIDRAGKPIATHNGWADYRLWGRLAVTANCSDILTVGAKPCGFMLSVMVPRDFDAEHLKQIVIGAEEECISNDVAFLGGDTKEAYEGQVVGAAIGTIDKKKVLSRGKARPGDILVLAGSIGGFVAGYNLLKKLELPDKERDEIVSYLAHPKARWREAKLFNEQELAVSATDLSDGLFDGLVTISDSTCGACVYLDELPYHPFCDMAASLLNIPHIQLGMGVGDWGILYAVSPPSLPTLIKHLCDDNWQLKIVGHVTEMPGVYAVDNEGDVLYEFHGMINENFRQRMEDQKSYFDIISGTNPLRAASTQTALNDHLTQKKLIMGARCD